MTLRLIRPGRNGGPCWPSAYAAPPPAYGIIRPWQQPVAYYPPSSPYYDPRTADYYRRHAARVRKLASETTTPAIREHLREVALEYERLAERVDSGAPLNGS